MLNMPLNVFLTNLEVGLGIRLTEEQKAFIEDFTTPTISFSSPGTGKTKSAIAGLITAETYYQIPGDQIYALSFTNMATIELKNRHEDDCRKLHMRQHVHFQTLHSLCTTILKENHYDLGMSKLTMQRSADLKSIGDMVQDACQGWGIDVQPRQIRPIVNAIRSLNSSLVFDREHVESKYDFKQTGLNYEDFTKIRKMLYSYNKLTETIEVQDILLYTLELLLKHPEIAENFRKKCKVMLVDEFQDLSLLQLRIISLLADNVIAIGDIKQQIYAFNGACQEIVAQFYKYYPTAKERNLTQSFRCKNEIAKYATRLILANRTGGEDFKGVSEGGIARIQHNIDLPMICEDIERQYRTNNNTFPKSILFLFRNNFSAIPIGDELFKRKVPFRINNYAAANTIPVIREMCEVVELALNPSNAHNVKALRYIIPEMKYYSNYTDTPIYKIMTEKGCSVFETNYQFREPGIASQAMNMLLEVQEMLHSSKPAADILNTVYPLFHKVYLKERAPYLEYTPDYYMSLVTPLVRTKTYMQFIQDEIKKLDIIRDCNNRRLGVRCYTFHAAKGLEADKVYIIDADTGIVPNTKKLDAMERAGCALEKAREIRNERSLVYVAATRAKEELYISTSKALSSMFLGTNEYEKYDDLYQSCKPVYPDVEAFELFTGARKEGT